MVCSHPPWTVTSKRRSGDALFAGASAGEHRCVDPDSLKASSNQVGEGRGACGPGGQCGLAGEAARAEQEQGGGRRGSKRVAYYAWRRTDAM